ncbi:MAG: DUF433 domain-containing protein [Leptolyngbya sp. IPPAS B-1204]
MTRTLPRTTTSRYVTRDPEILQGEPIIVGPRVAVRDLVEAWKAGTLPEQIYRKIPFVTTAQVFDALSFYLDNQTEIDEYRDFYR